MPLLDHFHTPLDERYPWESFHSGWATRIADQLSERVPAEFVVAEQTHSGNHLEIDVATFEDVRRARDGPSRLARPWLSPRPGRPRHRPMWCRRSFRTPSRCASSRRWLDSLWLRPSN